MPFVGAQIAICLPFLICAAYMGRLDDETALASFGACLAMVNICFNCFYLGFLEVLGSHASRGFGAGNFAMMSRALYQVPTANSRRWR